MSAEQSWYRISIRHGGSFPDRQLTIDQALDWYRHKRNQHPTLTLRLESRRSREDRWLPHQLNDPALLD